MRISPQSRRSRPSAIAQQRAVRRRGLRIGIAGLALVVTTSCTTTARPTSETWRPQWERQRDSLPEPEAFVAGDAQFCDALVGRARVNFPKLLPSPDPVLDNAVTAWIEQAEHLAFECPHSQPEVDDAFRNVDILSAEVDGALRVVAEE